MWLLGRGAPDTNVSRPITREYAATFINRKSRIDRYLGQVAPNSLNVGMWEVIVVLYADLWGTSSNLHIGINRVVTTRVVGNTVTGAADAI